MTPGSAFLLPAGLVSAGQGDITGLLQGDRDGDAGAHTPAKPDSLQGKGSRATPGGPGRGGQETPEMCLGRGYIQTGVWE